MSYADSNAATFVSKVSTFVINSCIALIMMGSHAALIPFFIIGVWSWFPLSGDMSLSVTKEGNTCSTSCAINPICFFLDFSGW